MSALSFGIAAYLVLRASTVDGLRLTVRHDLGQKLKQGFCFTCS